MSRLSKLLVHPVRFFKDIRVLGKRRVKGKSSTVFFNDVCLHQDIDVLLYFSATMDSIYQVEQWNPTLQRLRQDLNVFILVRQRAVYAHLKATTDFPLVLCTSLASLMAFYDRNRIKTIFYVNNANKNFQSLISGRSFHVHINHGESEKSSMYSNQSKAYDYVFCVSRAGVERYQKHLISMNNKNYIEVGRPQLDGIEPVSLPASQAGKKVILYAPTWKATHKTMDYASVGPWGERIVESIIKQSGYYLIYRPHPAVGTSDRLERHAHEKIVKAVMAAPNADFVMGVDINRLFPVVDLAIFDNSSVIIDFLKRDRPFIVTNINVAARGEAEVFKSGRQLNEDEVHQIVDIVADELENDTLQRERARVKGYYLGNYGEGEATLRFMEVTKEIISKWDKLDQSGDPRLSRSSYDGDVDAGLS